MKIEQQYWTAGEGWQNELATHLDGNASLILVFGATHVLGDTARMDEVRACYPGAPIVGCSTSGEILCNPRARRLPRRNGPAV